MTASKQGTLTDIRRELIDRNPDNMRKIFDEAKLQELAQSIKEHGLNTPIVVAERGDRYMLIAGERRFRAATLIDLDVLPAFVKVGLDDKQIAIASAVENLQRENLTRGEEAQGFEQLALKFELSDEDIATWLSKPVDHIQTARSLLVLPADVQLLVGEQAGQLPLRLAKMLVKIAARMPVKTLRKAVEDMLAAPDAETWQNSANQILLNVLAKHADELQGTHQGGWDLSWPKKPITIEDKQGELVIPACKGCEQLIEVGRTGNFCALARCFKAKREQFAAAEIQRISERTKVPVAVEKEKVTILKVGYGETDAIRRMIDSKAEFLRIVPSDGKQSRDYYAENLIGSRYADLAVTDKAAYEAALKVKPKKETGTSKAKTESPAALAKQQKINRNIKSIANKAMKDIDWLALHTAETVAPQIQMKGKTLELFSVYVAHHEQDFMRGWPELAAIIDLKNAAIGSATKVEQRETLRRELILLHLIGSLMGGYGDRWHKDWANAQKKIEDMIAGDITHPVHDRSSWTEGMGLKLMPKWNVAPIHRTAFNCWKCGKFVSGDHITKRDSSEDGWSIEYAKDGKTVLNVTCGDHQPLLMKQAKAEATTAKKGAAKKTAVKKTAKPIGKVKAGAKKNKALDVEAENEDFETKRRTVEVQDDEADEIASKDNA